MPIEPNRSTGRENKTASSHYYVPEMIPFALCNACFDIVLENSGKAREVYNEIKESYKLPDCQAVLSRLESKIPKGENLLHALVKKASLFHSKQGVPRGLALLKGGMDLAEEYVREFSPWIDLKNNRVKSGDLKYLFG